MGGKLKTTAQITAIPLPDSRGSIFDIDLYDVGIIFIWAALILSVISGIQYTISFWKKIR